jgi:hypothetical protein
MHNLHEETSQPSWGRPAGAGILPSKLSPSLFLRVSDFPDMSTGLEIRLVTYALGMLFFRIFRD